MVFFIFIVCGNQLAVLRNAHALNFLKQGG